MQQEIPKIQQPQPRRKVSVFGMVGLFIFILFMMGVIAAMISSGSATKNSTKKAVQPSPIGTTVRDAGFDFIVHSFKCGEKQMSTGELLVARAEAQGQFCRLNVTVTNEGKAAANIRAYGQYLFNAKEQRFDYDAHATTVAAGNYMGAEIDNSINPGNSITADIVFDVPVGDIPTIAELHGETDSQGVRVNLQ
jgi:hypothetical protein